MSEVLKVIPCPLCGEYPSLHDNPAADSVACFNPDCHMWGEWIPRKKWNTRPIEADLLAACKAMVYAFSAYDVGAEDMEIQAALKGLRAAIEKAEPGGAA